MRVLHVTTDLDVGGAQTVLCNLLSRIDPAAFQSEVVSLVGMGPMGPRIQALGVPVWPLGMRPGVPDPLGVLRLAGRMRRNRPDVVQTWMHHADLVGGIAAKLAGGIPVAWGIHHSTVDRRGSKRMTVWTARACARLSRWLPARIVCCGEAARRAHVALGYAAGRMLVIPNGFDVAGFRPDSAARDSVRRELGLSDSIPLIGLVARFNQQKGHRTFIQAAGRLHASAPESRFLLCGDGVVWGNPDLAAWIDEARIRDCCYLLGQREDIPRLTAAMDVATSSSFGEAFPIAVGEGMACGVPCVVTDVGDSALIVGETGVVVPPRDPEALAAGWRRLLLDTSREGRLQLGLAARQRIAERYSIEKVAAQYEDLYRQMAAHQRVGDIS